MGKFEVNTSLVTHLGAMKEIADGFASRFLRNQMEALADFARLDDACKDET